MSNRTLPVRHQRAHQGSDPDGPGRMATRMRRSCRRCHRPGPLGLVDGVCASQRGCRRRQLERLQQLAAAQTRLPAGPLLEVIEQRLTPHTSVQGLLGEAGASSYRRACKRRASGQPWGLTVPEIDNLCERLGIHAWAVYRGDWDAAVDRIAAAGRSPASARAS